MSSLAVSISKMEQSETEQGFIDPKIYNGAKKGDLLKNFNLGQCLDSKTTGGDNVLHIAVRFGHHDILQEALDGLHQLLFDPNSKGQTPLHIAVDNGHLPVVELLRESSRTAADVENGDGDRSEKLRSWRVKTDNKGDTALHKALRNVHQRAALLLLELDVDLAVVVNHDRESPLYLAAKSRCNLVLEKILDLGDDGYSVSGPFGLSPLHAAAQVSYNNNKTAVHYATERGYGDILKLLLEHTPKVACSYDCDGFTPLHRAAMAGSYYAMEVILNLCPQSIEFHDRKDGKNVLHLARMRNRMSFWRCLINKDIVHMVNEPDNDGNTPLHLAVIESDEEKVLMLLQSKSISRSCMISNNNHQTPMDLCRATNEQSSSDKNKIRQALEIQEEAWCSEAQIDLLQKNIFRRTCSTNVALIGKSIGQRFHTIERQFREIKVEDLKAMMNNMSLVATLVATITFTAAFTVLGGYDSNNGNVILIKKRAFQMFYLSNTVAMLLSLNVMMTYNYIHIFFGPQDLPMIAFYMATSIGCSIGSTAMAFLSGVFVVAYDDAFWIVILACIMRFYTIGSPLIALILSSTSSVPLFLTKVASVARDGTGDGVYLCKRWLKRI